LAAVPKPIPGSPKREHVDAGWMPRLTPSGVSLRPWLPPRGALRNGRVEPSAHGPKETRPSAPRKTHPDSAGGIVLHSNRRERSQRSARATSAVPVLRPVVVSRGKLPVQDGSQYIGVEIQVGQFIEIGRWRLDFIRFQCSWPLECRPASRAASGSRAE